MIVQPVLLGYLLRYFETYDPNDYHGLELACYYALGMSLCLLLLAVMHHILFFNTQKAGMKIRVAMCNMIFRKVSLFDGPWAEWVGLETGCRLPSVG
jgi:ATP-binding cassette subfamily C (CFTR/MRP) protein 4